MRLVGASLLVLGILACIYGGFWSSKDVTKVDLGPVQVKVEERERVNVPLWAGVAAIVGGALVLTLGRRRGA